jgi:uncharacterized protein
VTGRDWLKVCATYAGAVASGYVASRIGFPLPWMVGAMVFAGSTAILRHYIPIPVFTRSTGQTVVASSVGLSITPAAVSAIGAQFPVMLAAAFLTILAGIAAGVILMRLTRIDGISASLACIPGGPIEMAVLASRNGVAPGPVAFAQTLRVAMIVLIIPPLIVAVDGAPIDPAAALAADADLVGALVLLGIGISGGLLFCAIGTTSPFFLGPLLCTALASAAGLPVGGMPYWAIATAQVLLGVWLGRMFDRQLLERSAGFFPAVVASTLVLFALCGGIAALITATTGAAWQTAALAAAPGNVTEMALAAKVMQQGVALVAAYHVVRIFVILSTAPLIFRAAARLARRSR